MTTPSTSAQGPVAGSEPLTRAQWLMLPGHAQKRLNWLEAALASPSPAASPSVGAVAQIIAKWVDEKRYADAPAFQMAAREIIASLARAAAPEPESRDDG